MYALLVIASQYQREIFENQSFKIFCKQCLSNVTKTILQLVVNGRRKNQYMYYCVEGHDFIFQIDAYKTRNGNFAFEIPENSFVRISRTYLPFFRHFSGIMQQDNSEQVIIDPALIAKHYIRTWFFLDLLSSIPLDYIYLIFSSSNDVSNRCIWCIFQKYVKRIQTSFVACSYCNFRLRVQ